MSLQRALSHTVVQPWLFSSRLLFLEFPGPSGPQWILSSLLLWYFLDLHPLWVSQSLLLKNRAQWFLTLSMSSMSQAEHCSACPCVVLSKVQKGRGNRETDCFFITEENSHEEMSKRELLRVYRELRHVAAREDVHKHACRLKTLVST